MQVGFFAEAGPLQVFVSGHLIPEDFEFTTRDDSQFVTADASTRIRQGTEVRVRIVGTRTDATEIVSYTDTACPSCIFNAYRSGMPPGFISTPHWLEKDQMPSASLCSKGFLLYTCAITCCPQHCEAAFPCFLNGLYIGRIFVADPYTLEAQSSPCKRSCQLSYIDLTHTS